MSGIERIAKERQRQIEVEGWTPEHDNQYTDSQLARAANSYILIAVAMSDGWPLEDKNEVPDGWPWSASWWKPSSDPIRNLEKAGALIAAEIDRIERLATPAALRTKRSRP